MTTTMISSLALWDAARTSVSRTQNQLGAVSQEVTTGRHYDVGIALGTDTARTINTRVLIEDITSIVGMNGVASERLSTMQSSITGMIDIARSLFEQATQAGQQDANRTQFIDSARSMLATLTDLLSATNNGTYVFAGPNSLSVPVGDYISNPPSSSRAVVTGAFASEFGVSPDDPAAGSITADQIKAYWNGSYSTLFQPPNWQTTFSSASDDPTELRIGPQERASYSVNANDPGIRRLYAALVAVVDTGATNLSASAFGALAGLVAESASAAASDLTHSQASLGETKSRITKASDRMAINRTVLERVVGGLEGVDQVEASTRLNSLTTQLQVSYAVTARMFKLSLLDYL